jgi:hypothetical protein
VTISSKISLNVTHIPLFELKMYGSMHIYKTPWQESASELYRPSDRRLSEMLVSTFADRGCRVVSGEDPLRPHFRLSGPEPLLFLPSSFSVVLTRLSGPRSRPTTFK